MNNLHTKFLAWAFKAFSVNLVLVLLLENIFDIFKEERKIPFSFFVNKSLLPNTIFEDSFPIQKICSSLFSF